MSMIGLLAESNNKIYLKNLPEPDRTNENVIAKVLSCAVCGTDIRIFSKGSDKINTPRIIGHEVCVEIVHIGKSLTLPDFSIGQRVLVVPAIGCGECKPCSRGFTNMCSSLKTLGFQYDGGFAEWMEIPLQAFRMGNVIHLPEQLDPDDAVLCEPVACVLNSQEMLNIGKNDTVVIFGAGFIGCMHAELAVLKGVRRLLMVEFSGFRSKQALEMIPGIILIQADKVDVVKEIKTLTGGLGADVLIAACSVGKTHSQALEAAGPRARISLFGGLPEPSVGFIDSNLIHYKELSVFGVHASTAKQNRKIMAHVEKQELNLRKYISKFYKLEDIMDVFEDLGKEDLLKVVVKP